MIYYGSGSKQVLGDHRIIMGGGLGEWGIFITSAEHIDLGARLEQQSDRNFGALRSGPPQDGNGAEVLTEHAQVGWEPLVQVGLK